MLYESRVKFEVSCTTVKFLCSSLPWTVESCRGCLRKLSFFFTQECCV